MEDRRVEIYNYIKTSLEAEATDNNNIANVIEANINKAKEEEELSINEIKEIIDKHTSTYQGVYNKEVKRELKKQEKQNINFKFVVGKTYRLKNKSLIGNSKYDLFVCKKFIYTINDIPTNLVIMKPINTNKMYKGYTLTKEDCIKYHIKYEPNLYVYSMKLKWIKS